MSIMYGIIEIHFLNCLTKNAEKFLHSVNNQLNELGIKIQYSVCKEKIMKLDKEQQKHFAEAIRNASKKKGFKVKGCSIYVLEAMPLFTVIILLIHKKCFIEYILKIMNMMTFFGKYYKCQVIVNKLIH